MIPHNKVIPSPADTEAVSKVIASGQWACGKQVRKLEGAISALTQRKHAVAVASGVSALRLALLALSIGKGDEVIIPAYSCVALANAVLSTGATPIPADIEPHCWNISKATASAVFTPHTKAIIAVHTFGMPADIPTLKSLGVPVIEDCAHALGAGTFGMHGDIAISSFYATKLIGAGEGGMLLTNRKEIADFAYSYRDYSDQAPQKNRLNDKMTDIEAALALSRLKRLPSYLKSRQHIAESYLQLLTPLQPKITLPRAALHRVWYRFAIEFNETSLSDVIKAMAGEGIVTAEPIYDWRNSKQKEKTLQATHAYHQLLSLPLYPGLTKQEIRSVTDTLIKVIA